MRFVLPSFLLFCLHFGPVAALMAQPPVPLEPPCRSDLDGDGHVDMADVLLMFTDFGLQCDLGTDSVADWPLIQFSELHYNPGSAQGADNEFEFLELHNPGEEDVDLSGWSISEGLDVVMPGGTSIEAGGFLVLTTAPLTYSGLGYPVLDWGSGGLNNSGELLALRAPNGAVIESVNFSDTGLWDSAPDGQGPSLERLHLYMDAHAPEAWSASISVGGTPGMVNSLWVD